MYNPVRLVMGNRRRMRVGAEFKYCPDGSQVQFNMPCPGEPSGKIPLTDLLKPGGFGGGLTNKPSGGLTPNWGPGPGGGVAVYDPPAGPYTPPGGGGGGPTYQPPYTPPGGGGSGGSGGPVYEPPYTPPYTPPGGGGSGGSGGPVYEPPYTPPGSPRCAPPAIVCPENQKRITMPFVPDAGFTTTVLAGAEVRFVGRPQYLFKPDRLIIGSEITPFFDVVNFIIGNNNQSLSQGATAASMYSEVATYVDMSFDQCYPGIDVVLIARNKSAVTQTFQAQLVGWADKP